MTTTVTVCLCTFKRSSLGATLLSLDKQDLPPGVALDIVVVDSDLAGSAHALVSQTQATMTVPVRYVLAARPGVAAARNKAVTEATGHWLAFIDDDETAAPNWLAQLLTCAERFDAQVVFGALLTIYPSACPEWIKTGDLFGRQLPPTGTYVNHGPTGNTLVARAVLDGEQTILILPMEQPAAKTPNSFSGYQKKGSRW
jgi:succinoglycan biosynthesis protein ExoM